MKKYCRNQTRPKFACLVALTLSITGNLFAQHIDVNAGAASIAQGQPLRFNNGSTFNTNSLYVRPLILATSGTFAGYYYSSGITFTGVGTGLGSAAAPGTQIRLRFVSVSGPEGGSFGIWDVPGFNPGEVESTALAFSIPVGTTNATNSILISENNGETDADPYGHIHGRNYTATQPGLYVVGLQLYDAASNGSGGGPIHSPSAIYPMYFQAGITIASLTHSTSNLAVTFASQNGKSYHLQTTANPALPNSWTNLAGPFTGSHLLRTVTDTNVHHAIRLYRLRVTTP
jgi:hypothetical protein